MKNCWAGWLVLVGTVAGCAGREGGLDVEHTLFSEWTDPAVRLAAGDGVAWVLADVGFAHSSLMAFDADGQPIGEPIEGPTAYQGLAASDRRLMIGPTTEGPGEGPRRLYRIEGGAIASEAAVSAAVRQDLTPISGSRAGWLVKGDGHAILTPDGEELIDRLSLGVHGGREHVTGAMAHDGSLLLVREADPTTPWIYTIERDGTDVLDVEAPGALFARSRNGIALWWTDDDLRLNVVGTDRPPVALDLWDPNAHAVALLDDGGGVVVLASEERYGAIEAIRYAPTGSQREPVQLGPVDDLTTIQVAALGGDRVVLAWVAPDGVKLRFLDM